MASRFPNAANVALRDVRDYDLPVFFGHQTNPAAVHMVGFLSRDPADKEAFMAHWAKIRSDPAVLQRTIIADGQIAGYAGAFENQGRREVCYYLGQPFWGKGIATTALSLFLQEITARPLFAAVAGDNIGSIRVLEKCGFVVVARIRSFAQARNAEIDEVIMQLR